MFEVERAGQPFVVDLVLGSTPARPRVPTKLADTIDYSASPFRSKSAVERRPST